MITFTDTPLWNSKLNQKLWKMYLAKIPANLWDSASPITWPISTHPIRTYVETAEFDCLRDEGLDYADSLKDAGREIVVHQTRQTIHGYDMNLKSPITEESVQKRIAFLKESFKNNK